MFTKQQKIIIGIIGFVVLFFLLVFLGVIPGLRRSGPSASLTVWGVGDNGSVWGPSVQAFEKTYPNISVSYTQLDQASYESKLINALAAGQGPDIFMFNNSWLPKHNNIVVPAPSSLISASTFESIFPQVATNDFVNGGHIYAMPLSIDTLALIYNRDIFNQSGIAVPPATWSQFEKVVLQTRKETYGIITRPAVALGGTLNSMANATDILNLLFLQEGTQMLDPNTGQATFASQQGQAALSFYTKFAVPGGTYYTWYDPTGSALNSFASGKSAMFLGYASQIPQIKSQNPNINLGVSAMPQFSLSSQVNYPDYWGLAVSRESQYPTEAWDFINFVTTNQSVADSYAASSGRPPALRSLIAQYQSNATLGPYASQALTAEDWVQPDSDAVSTIFSNMIESVLNKSASVNRALQVAETSVNSLGTGQ
ncbi:MAG: extracellular solute-binding protein [Patescibacteria group bacterium]|nr:extracellular solute-binding protein [Patescibacteria group bacterium]MCL5224097.1 extracellular solute-binding protein [Patescibacteria group bacterium]